MLIGDMYKWKKPFDLAFISLLVYVFNVYFKFKRLIDLNHLLLIGLNQIHFYLVLVMHDNPLKSDSFTNTLKSQHKLK